MTIRFEPGPPDPPRHCEEQEQQPAEQQEVDERLVKYSLDEGHFEVGRVEGLHARGWRFYPLVPQQDLIAQRTWLRANPLAERQPSIVRSNTMCSNDNSSHNDNRSACLC